MIQVIRNLDFSNTGPIFEYPRIHPFGVDLSSLRGDVYSRHETAYLFDEVRATGTLLGHPTGHRRATAEHRSRGTFVLISLKQRRDHFSRPPTQLRLARSHARTKGNNFPVGGLRSTSISPPDFPHGDFLEALRSESIQFHVMDRHEKQCPREIFLIKPTSSLTRMSSGRFSNFSVTPQQVSLYWNTDRRWTR